MIGALEAGGTKFVLGLVDTDGSILKRHRIATTTPSETLTATINWFQSQGPIEGLGIASFGPCDTSTGTILETPKPGWAGTPMKQILADALGVPTAFDTDVNGAAHGELSLGAGTGASSLAYVTVGTGVGVGLAWDGGTWTHMGKHPEMGHISVKRHPDDLAFAGHCPFHGDCLEGLASGPAILARWGTDLSSDDSPETAAAIIGFYLGQLAVAIEASLFPEVIVFGGGVTKAPGLMAEIKRAADDFAGGYWTEMLSDKITVPGLGENSGLLGAAALIDPIIAKPA